MADVRHEPIRHNYLPPHYYREYEATDCALESAVIAGHVQSLERDASSRHYVEVSWQNFAAIPMLVEKFGKRIKLVHVYRHPISNCFSLLAHRFYYPKVLRGDSSRALLNPDIDNMLTVEDGGSWDSYSPFEKCLHYWMEINSYVGELQERYPHIPMLSVSAEGLFDTTGETFERVVEFIGLPNRSVPKEDLDRRIDKFSKRAVLIDRWESIFEFPKIVAKAESLGYDFENISDAKLLAKYGPRSFPETTIKMYGLLARHPKLVSQLRNIRNRMKPGTGRG